MKVLLCYTIQKKDNPIQDLNLEQFVHFLLFYLL